MQTPLTQTGADSAFAGSAFLAGTAWIADLTPILTVAATVVAIIAGVFAAWYHFERAMKMRKERKDGQGQ